MATLVQSSARQPPPNHTLEDVAEEMLNGILCHYEPPPDRGGETQLEDGDDIVEDSEDTSSKKSLPRRGILRAPKAWTARMGGVGHKNSKHGKNPSSSGSYDDDQHPSIRPSSSSKSVRWSDTASSSAENENSYHDRDDDGNAKKRGKKDKKGKYNNSAVSHSKFPVEVSCNLSGTCTEVGIEAGCLSPNVEAYVYEGNDDDGIAVEPPSSKAKKSQQGEEKARAGKIGSSKSKSATKADVEAPPPPPPPPLPSSSKRMSKQSTPAPKKSLQRVSKYDNGEEEEDWREEDEEEVEVKEKAKEVHRRPTPAKRYHRPHQEYDNAGVGAGEYDDLSNSILDEVGEDDWEISTKKERKKDQDGVSVGRRSRSDGDGNGNGSKRASGASSARDRDETGSTVSNASSLFQRMWKRGGASQPKKPVDSDVAYRRRYGSKEDGSDLTAPAAHRRGRSASPTSGRHSSASRPKEMMLTLDPVEKNRATSPTSQQQHQRGGFFLRRAGLLSPKRSAPAKDTSDWDESIPIVRTGRAPVAELSIAAGRNRTSRSASPHGRFRYNSKERVVPAASQAEAYYHPAHPLVNPQQDLRQFARGGSMDERQSLITAHRQGFDRDSVVMAAPQPSRPAPFYSTDDALERQSFITAHRLGFDGGKTQWNVPAAGMGIDDALERQSYITAHRLGFDSTAASARTGTTPVRQMARPIVPPAHVPPPPPPPTQQVQQDLGTSYRYPQQQQYTQTMQSPPMRGPPINDYPYAFYPQRSPAPPPSQPQGTKLPVRGRSASPAPATRGRSSSPSRVVTMRQRSQSPSRLPSRSVPSSYRRHSLEPQYIVPSYSPAPATPPAPQLVISRAPPPPPSPPLHPPPPPLPGQAQAQPMQQQHPIHPPPQPHPAQSQVQPMQKPRQQATTIETYPPTRTDYEYQQSYLMMQRQSVPRQPAPPSLVQYGDSPFAPEPPQAIPHKTRVALKPVSSRQATPGKPRRVGLLEGLKKAVVGHGYSSDRRVRSVAQEPVMPLATPRGGAPVFLPDVSASPAPKVPRSHIPAVLPKSKPPANEADTDNTQVSDPLSVHDPYCPPATLQYFVDGEASNSKEHDPVTAYGTHWPAASSPGCNVLGPVWDQTGNKPEVEPTQSSRSNGVGDTGPVARPNETKPVQPQGEATSEAKPSPDVELSWEERTRQAWERIRNGLVSFGEPQETVSEVLSPCCSENGDAAKSATRGNGTHEESRPEPVLLPEIPMAKGNSAQGDAMELPVNRSLMNPHTSTQPSAQLYMTGPYDPSKPIGILKQPSYDRRVTFGEPTEQVYDDPTEDAQSYSTDPSSKRKRVFRGRRMFSSLLGKGGIPKANKLDEYGLPHLNTRSTEASSVSGVGSASHEWDNGSQYPNNYYRPHLVEGSGYDPREPGRPFQPHNLTCHAGLSYQ